MASLHLAQEILDIMWPVGSIYLSDNTTNPNTKFGGTWVRLSGGFIYGSTVASGSSYSTGNGSGTTTNDHTLTIDQMPKHSHLVMTNIVHQDGTPVHEEILNAGIFYGDGRRRLVSTCDYQGNNKGHRHSIPFLACSIWRRTK